MAKKAAKKRGGRKADLQTRYTEAMDELEPSMPAGVEAFFAQAFGEMRRKHPRLAKRPRLAAPFLAARVRQLAEDANVGFEIDPDNCEKWMEVIKMWIELFMSFGI